MNPNSPMMHRVARQKHGPLLPIALPKKGRIRIVLALLALAFVIRVVPTFIKSIHLPKITFPSFPDKKHPAKSFEKTVKHAPPHVSGTLADKALDKLLKNPSHLAAVQPLVLSGKDSFTVYTSIDTTLTRYLETLFVRYHPLYGAIVAMHPTTGRILALISYTNDSMPDLGANLGAKSIFPAASTFKTITAAAAIEHADYTPDCLLEHRGRSSTLYRSQINPVLDWTVDISLSQAYARSVNAVFARIGLYDVGRKQLLATAQSFGFNAPVPGDIPCEPSVATCSDSTFDIAEFASGFNQRTLLSPLHGACIAAAISQEGTMPTPTLIDSIVHQKSGEKKYSATPAPWQQAITPSTAAALRTLMHSVIVYGTGRKHFKDMKNSNRFNDFSYGGKTGSVDKDGIGRIDWFIGFATHPQFTDERIAVAAVSAHGAYWTVHSSYLAAEAMRYYLRNVQKAKETVLAQTSAPLRDSTTSKAGN